MKIGGLQKTTLIDYPGKVACTVFLVGCNFRCPFCYSGELVLPERIKEHPEIPEEDFFSFLEERKGLLEGVCILGGEPTIHQDLPDFARKIKEMGYLVKIDSNGSNPEMLEKLINQHLIDYIAMDVKAPFSRYDQAAGVKVDIGKIKKSISLIKTSGVDYGFRTTVVPGFLKKEDLLQIAKDIGKAKRFCLQNFSTNKPLIDPSFEKLEPYKDEYLEEIKEEVLPFFQEVIIR